MNMDSAPVQPSPVSLFEAVKRGEKKKAALIGALHATSIGRENIELFVGAMNEVANPIAVELISLAWPSLDADCRVRISRDWLDGKEKDQQAGGYHALAARLLAEDSEASMFFLDRATKLAATSPPCRKRIISTTRSEWIGTTSEQARFRKLDPKLLSSSGRIMILEWLGEACQSELHPSDNERRRGELQKQAQVRTSILAQWLDELQHQPIPEAVASGVARCIAKLRLRPAAGNDPSTGATPGGTPTTAQSIAHTEPAAAVRPAPTVASPPPPPALQGASSALSSGEDEQLRTAFELITRLFQKESEQHRRRLASVVGELTAAKAQQERADRDAAAYRSANVAAVERVTGLEEQVRALTEARDKAVQELSAVREKLDQVSAELNDERQRGLALRHESHEAVSRETQRERERLLGQVAQQVRNLEQAYREIRARGPLPEGTPRMVGDMMDELLSRLEAVGVRFARE
ncbi:MAG TPA: hypothetical protein VGI81_03715 [Tepidisphaeraceae bacterium]